jgi:hypothetical protein
MEVEDGETDPIGDHPLCERVHALCVSLHQDAKKLGIAFHEDETNALHKLYRGIIYASGKLAGALNGNEDDDGCLEPGITVAWLKRALNFLHEAIDGAAAALDQDAAPKPWIETVRTELLDIRTEILRLMDTYRRLI